MAAYEEEEYEAIRKDPARKAAIDKAVRNLNRVAKWRSIFTGWFLGTRPKGDPQSDAMRDIQERLILLRVEQSAFVNLLANKGLITREEFTLECGVQAEELEKLFRTRFPGAQSSDEGMIINPAEAAVWMSKFPM